MKNTVEVKTAFIMQAYNSACSDWKARIKEELPDLFNLEYHKWYIHHDEGETFLFFPNDKGDAVGFFRGNQWKEGYVWRTNDNFIRESRLATDDEIIQHFTPEINKRGLCGKYIRVISDNNMKGKLSEWKLIGKVEVGKDGNIIIEDDGGFYTVYIPKEDIWAEPVPELTPEEIFERYQVVVKQ